MNYAVIWTKAAIDQLAQAWVDAKEAAKMSPTVVFMDDNNKITEVKKL